ncbi:MAG: ribosome biogenesis GTP-binding protein YihA/YsxC [Balneolaceae bacterium]
MAFTSAQFICGAPSLAHCPDPDLPEFCLTGRSNVGKSSLINRITGRKRLARTSNTPGKTQQMNYYRIDDAWYLVDLPGFGFAKVPEAIRKDWERNIRTYLLERNTIELVLHLVDCRHEATSIDEELFFWLASNRRPFSVLLTKGDKLSANKRMQSKQRLIRTLSEMNIEVPVLLTSAETGDGIGEVQSLIAEFAKPTNTEPET